jgi:2-methylfumaryl-CoA isomerase
MIVALTARQWSSLKDVTGIGPACGSLEQTLGHDLDTEAGRFDGRDLIAAVLRPWFASRNLSEIRATFAGTGVSWGPYQSFRQLVDEDPRASSANPMFRAVEQPGIGRYLMPSSPLHFGRTGRLPPRPAPVLGQDTDAVLAEVLGLSPAEIGDLHDRVVVAGS